MKTFTEYTELLNNTFTKKDVIAPVESSSEASRPYAVGEKFFYNNILYEATDVIASGGIIDPDTNCEEAEDIVSQIENKTIVTDAVPTEDSTNPVQSGGVYDSLAPVYNVLGAKNLLPNIGVETATNLGITYTKQSDGSVIANGTATGWAYYNLCSSFTLDAGTYILSGKSSLSGTQIKLMNADTDADITIIETLEKREFTLSTKTNVHAMLYVGTAAGTVTNFVFKPMIRLASITDDTYAPYCMTNKELTDRRFSNPNLLDNPFFTVNQRGVTSYSDNSYGVDRWKCTTMTNRTTEVVANGIKDSSISGESTSHCFYQYIDAVGLKLKGKTVTVTVYIPEITSDTKLNLLCRNSTWSGLSSIAVYTAGYHSMTFTIPSDATDTLIIDCELTSSVESGKYVIIGAIKLEIGSVSTLAMDTAPNYAEELLKCQRYFIRYDMSTKTNGTLFLASKYGGDSTVFGNMYLPTSMRATPTVTTSGSIRFLYYPTATATTITSFYVQFIEKNILKIGAVLSDATDISSGMVGEVQASHGIVDFSADL